VEFPPTNKKLLWDSEIDDWIYLNGRHNILEDFFATKFNYVEFNLRLRNKSIREEDNQAQLKINVDIKEDDNKENEVHGRN
jgi:hypothetical protein